MVTIGKIPGKLQRSFRPLRSSFTQRAWGPFWPLVLATTISHGCTIERLAKALRGSTHRTNHEEFLRRSCRSQSQVIQTITLDMLRELPAENQVLQQPLLSTTFHILIENAPLRIHVCAWRNYLGQFMPGNKALTKSIQLRDS